MTSSDPFHLARRWWRAVRARPLTEGERDAVSAVLTPAEAELFFRFAAHDQRHALDVLARLDARHGDAPREVRSAALLHDIGKLESDLSISRRVAASILGTRWARYARYHAHEEIGAELLRSRGSDPLTVSLVAGTASGRWATLLREADRI